MLITRDEVAVVPCCKTLRCRRAVPLVGGEADDLEARSQCLKLGANDFWVQDAPSDLLQRLGCSSLSPAPNPV